MKYQNLKSLKRSNMTKFNKLSRRKQDAVKEKMLYGSVNFWHLTGRKITPRQYEVMAKKVIKEQK